MENISQHLFLYCERGLNSAFWAEPVNALSNFAFIFAAIIAYSKFCRGNNSNWELKTLVILTAIVGIGSFIFHTIATKTAILADIIPIVIFIHFSVYAIFHQALRLKSWQAALCAISFLGFNVAILQIFGRTLFNGSIQYLPTLAFLIIVSAAISLKKLPGERQFELSSFVFSVSIFCRSFDQAFCHTFPLGLHFMWHILNAVTMYYVMKGLIYNLRSSAAHS